MKKSAATRFAQAGLVPFAVGALLIMSCLQPGAAFATEESQLEDAASEDEIAAYLASGSSFTSEEQIYIAALQEAGKTLGTLSLTETMDRVTSGLTAFSESDSSMMRPSETTKAVTTASGRTAADTAAAQALDSFPSGCTSAILMNYDYGAQSTPAISLAGALDCPILLLNAEYVPDGTQEALAELGVSQVYVIGGESVVSAEVEETLKTDLSLEVTRIEGSSAAELQQNIFDFGQDRNLWDDVDTIIVVSGATVSACDALSASPLAYKLHAPIFFVDSEGMLSDETKDFLASATQFKRALVIGGTAVVSEYTFGYLQGITTAHSGSVQAYRLGGSSLYDTSLAVAEWATSNGILTWDNAALTTGYYVYDSLGGSVLQGKRGAVMLMLDTDDTEAIDALAEHDISKMTYFGGKNVYSNVFKAQTAGRLGFDLYEIQGMRIYVDAGHGWNSSNNDAFDTGATGSGTTEAAETARLAREVGAYLRWYHDIDVYINDEGWYKTRNAQAASLDCGALVCIHFNASGGSGTESYIHPYYAAEGSAELQASTHEYLVNALGLRDRGMGYMELAVCNGKVPAVLLEICFIDTESDMDTYWSKEDDVAYAIAYGTAAAVL